MTATYHKHLLNFKQASGTSRGILKTKDTWFLIICRDGKKGIGECGMFKGLSVDDRPDFESKLQWACDNIHLGLENLVLRLQEFPSIQCGLEMAFNSLESKDVFDLFPSAFTKGIDHININGLIWMGSETFMKQQIKEKLDSGFRCIKMKIGAIDFASEIGLLKSIREEFSAADIELRVDANGAFSAENALEKLKRLSHFDLHSIEQPIQQGQTEAMAGLCEQTPLPIALDEELIGVFSEEKKQELLQIINPQYIILKPTLIGGFTGSQNWIDLAEKQQIGWWVTSALESNIGLNAIAQWTYTLQNQMPQGLGTGSLFSNNFDSPLKVKNANLHYDQNKHWDLKNLGFQF
ncbi:o-succinylbenzoate synthase [Subsaximicrobium wynnwilliamsii]|uniref:O-succinylbenzoate synthase n=1 Tax=Subsaximicrobium wynnwilliamsii TaxID=291179 RepID=A0A5C6ZFC9_9FLAO|nr:o-succinylbenzoate synthase [Subsaximicrobium wynnwilliamsii]TXD82980.1 o-succinylbenzoate synthase [Subsaximicrobium wynnwilliamsii]TXD88702.1 o-succinylbenzoate synthase [Subsaximicrobium wynnwilliamsii]TXE02795.1 o-succinylbenzoate synthase [Subsaximicrobium wynnwilliamsii]